MTAVTIQSNKIVSNTVRQLSATRAILWKKLNELFGQLNTWKQDLPDIILAGTLILDFVASRIVKNKFLLFVNYLVHGLLLLQSEQTIIATMLIF